MLLQKDILNKGRTKPPYEKHLQHTSLTEISVYAKNCKLTQERVLWARAVERLRGEDAMGAEPWHLQASGSLEGGPTTTAP